MTGLAMIRVLHQQNYNHELNNSLLGRDTHVW